MKKIKYVLLAICIAALCVSAAGCKATADDTSSVSVSSVASAESDGGSVSDEESVAVTTTAETTPETSKQTTTTAAKDDNAIYNSILKKYSNAIKDVDTALNKHDDDVNSELLIAVKSYEGEKFSVYYSFSDINKDGVNELIIGAGDGSQSTVIYDILSNNGKKPVHLFDLYSLGYRSSLTIYNSGILRMDGSNGADSHSVAFYKLPSGKTSPELIEEIGTEDGKYYRISADGKRSDSSEKEYNAIENSHDESKKEIVWNEIKY